MTRFQVALVEPDRPSGEEVVRLLQAADLRAAHHLTLGRFLDALAKRRPDAVLMDLHMPGMEGREIIRALRGDDANRRLIIIGLSGLRARGEAAEVFRAGADEYFEKPVDPRLLVVRLKTLLERVNEPVEEAPLRHGAISVCPTSRVCRIGERDVELTRLEFDLLLRFVQNPNRVLTRGNLIDTIWGGRASMGARAVDRHVHALRTKLGIEGRWLETYVGIGYCLCDGKAKPVSGSSK